MNHANLNFEQRYILVCDVRSKLYANTPLRRRSALLRLRIRPKQLAHQPLFGWLAISLDVAKFFQLDTVSWEKATVHDEDTSIQAVAQRQPVVHLCEEMRHLLRVFRLHLPFEPIHLVHRDTFVVPCKTNSTLTLDTEIYLVTSPLDIKKWLGNKSLKPNKTKMHSTENDPLSTKSPLNNWNINSVTTYSS